MNIGHWLSGWFSTRGKSLSHYRKGKARATRHDHQGAISGYTAAINVPDAPSDVKAMALYNRAMVHVATGDEASGIGDLNAVLAMTELLVNVKTMARQKLARMESRSVNSKASKRAIGSGAH